MDKKIRAQVAGRMNELGLTNADVARKLNITPQAVGQLINGQRGRIPDSLSDLLASLGLELDVKVKG